MRILLDTHVFLWWLDNHPKLSSAATATITAAAAVFVSSASIWEVALKVQRGKLNVDLDRMVAQIASNGFQELPVTAKHAAIVGHLPLLHNDPFDRILIAQARCEPLRLLSADRLLAGYSDLVDLI